MWQLIEEKIELEVDNPRSNIIGPMAKSVYVEWIIFVWMKNLC